MPQLHINQIKKFLHTRFKEYIDMSDWTSRPSKTEDVEKAFLSRGIAALALTFLTSDSPSEVCLSITDGFEDNGIDAVHIDESEETIYLVQAKWSKNTRSSIDVGSVEKFMTGVKRLINSDFDKFNEKFKDREDEIADSLATPGFKVVLCLAYSGQEDISSEVEDTLSESIDELNGGIDESFSYKTVSQKSLYESLKNDADGGGVNLKFSLGDWSEVTDPYEAYYGRISASIVAEWYQYKKKIFDKNIRSVLRDSSVNRQIEETLLSNPKSFWYFNNGITVLCDSIEKSPGTQAGSGEKIFLCKGMNVVNGAQTVGSIAKAFAKNPEKVANAVVSVRLISLNKCPDGFGEDVTRSNNTQNQIDDQSFIVFDDNQDRLRIELQIEGISYTYRPGSTPIDDDTGFSFKEAVACLACNLEDVSRAARVKSNIGEFWKSTKSRQYKSLFNPSLDGLKLWKLVQIQRCVEKALEPKRKRSRQNQGRSALIAKHANRFILHVVYKSLDDSFFYNVSSTSISAEQKKG